MKQALGGKGQVVVLVGSLTASNAVERIQGFEDALKGTDIKVVQKLSDGMDASKALSNAQTAFQTNPDINGLYGVYSYDGPSAGQAVQAAGKSGRIKIISDDSDPQTLKFVKSGVIQATVLQQPYQQGYTGAYLLAAFKVLGKERDPRRSSSRTWRATARRSAPASAWSRRPISPTTRPKLTRLGISDGRPRRAWPSHCGT